MPTIGFFCKQRLNFGI